MMQSENIADLVEALAKAQGEFPDIHKSNVAKIQHKNQNTSHTYKYADLADILKAATPVLAANGLTVTQMVDCTENGNMVLRTTLAHKSGQFMQGTMPVGFNGGDPKALGSMLTYYRRYSFTALVGICADEDDDANAAGNHEQRPANSQRNQPPRKPPQREGNPFDDAPGDDVMVDYVASSGEVRSIPLGKAINTLYSAHQAPQLSNDAYSGLLAKNADWLKRHDPKHYAILSNIDIRQPEAA